MSRLEELVKELPPELHGQAEDFLQFLMLRHGRQHPLSRLRGAIEDLPYNSVELQHKAQDWWYESVSARREHSAGDPAEPGKS